MAPSRHAPAHSTHARTSARATRSGILALAVAVLALFAVVATLIGVGRTTRSHREEIIRTLEPARNQLYELQRLLALQEAEQRGGAPPPALRGDLPAPAARGSDQREALVRLRALAGRAGPEALEAFVELRAYVERWQAGMEQAVRSPGSAELRRLTQAEYAEVLRSADRLHRALNREVDERRACLRVLERLEVGLIVGMVLLALVAILVMGRVGREQAELVERTRRLAEESESRREEIERVTEEKARFIRGITHDLKNPLGAIDAYGQLLEAGIKGELTGEQRKYVERIRGAAQHMLGTLQDLLELARAEAGGIRIERREADLHRVVRDAAEDYRAALETAGLSLRLELPERLPRVVTDERRVREILGNLLSNAVKYTPRGGRVWVRAQARAEGPGEGGFVAVEVRDTGPGIPEEAQESIFEEFERLDRESAPGSGVGLAISRRLARLMGGDLTVSSREGHGSTFVLRIPLRASSSSPAEPLLEG